MRGSLGHQHEIADIHIYYILTLNNEVHIARVQHELIKGFALSTTARVIAHCAFLYSLLGPGRRCPVCGGRSPPRALRSFPPVLNLALDHPA